MLSYHLNISIGVQFFQIYINIQWFVHVQLHRHKCHQHTIVMLLNLSKIYVQVILINTKIIEMYASYMFSNLSEQNKS